MILCGMRAPRFAAFNEADSDHGRCAQFLASNWSRLVIPSVAVTEVCHLLSDPQRRGRVGLAAEFCAAIADDELRVIKITPHDYRRMAELLTTPSSLRLQGQWMRAWSRSPSGWTSTRSPLLTAATFR